MSTHDSARKLHFTYRLPLSPTRVFDALTQPVLMSIWMYPDGDTDYDFDVRVGGKWSITSRRDGTEYVASGDYLDVKQPTRLVYTYGMPQFSPNSDTISIEITPDGEGSIVSFTESGIDIAAELAELKDGETSQSEIGWRQGFESLEAKASEIR